VREHVETALILLPTVPTRSFDGMKFTLKKRRGLHMVYFSFPYTDDTERRRREVQAKVLSALSKRREVLGFWDSVPLVPHYCFDALFDWPAGYTHEEIGLWEIELISRCEFFVFDPENLSSGVRWEKCIAETLGKNILTFEEFAKGALCGEGCGGRSE
jgi:hypothetical protein